MTAVDAVEVADRDDRGTESVRDVGELGPALHTAPVETPTGLVSANCGRRGPGPACHLDGRRPKLVRTSSGRREDEHRSHGAVPGLDQRDEPAVRGDRGDRLRVASGGAESRCPYDRATASSAVRSRTGNVARAESASDTTSIGTSGATSASSSSVRGDVEPVATDPRAPQRGQVSADTEPGTEVAGERPDVGPRRDDDGHVDVEHATRVGQRRARRAPRTATTVTGRAASSTSSPARTRAYARWPSTLIAETALGTCWIVARERGDPRVDAVARHAGGVGGRERLALGVVGGRR